MPGLRIKGQTNNADIIIAVCCTPSRQDDDIDKLFVEELKDTYESTALVLMGDLNLPEIT